MDEKDSIEYKIKTADVISNRITQGDYITALSAIEHLPDDFKKDALYAGVAVYLQELMNAPSKMGGQYKNPLMEQLMNYCKGQSKYLKQ
jgi:hypothetical protein